MVTGGIDIYTTRREYHHKCSWWKRDDTDRDTTELVHNAAPNGIFYAKEVNYESNNNNVVDRFMFENSDIQIKSLDNLREISPNDVVLFDDEIWIVKDVQRKNIHKNAQFGRHTSFITYLRIAK